MRNADLAWLTVSATARATSASRRAEQGLVVDGDRGQVREATLLGESHAARVPGLPAREKGSQATVKCVSVRSVK